MSYTTSDEAPDKRHFDNPMYAQSTLGITNNTKTIHNELNNELTTTGTVNKFKSNVEVEKSKTCGQQQDCCGAIASGSNEETANVYAEVEDRPQRSRDDNYNPNIYHSIEDLKSLGHKKEPFYEEVKRRCDEGLPPIELYQSN